MCGRFSLTASARDVQEAFALAGIEPFPPRYNIAPTQPVVIIARKPGEHEAGANRPDRHAVLARWGLIPAWVKDPKGFPLLINARAETAATKASFRAAMRHRRVLVPTSGFYEWRSAKGSGEKGSGEERSGKKRSGDKRSGQKAQAFWVRPRNGGVIAFAGLLEHYLGPDGSEIDTVALLTCAARGALAAIHDRAPVVIAPESYERWLDCRTFGPDDVASLLQPGDPDFFEAIAVSDLVNKVANTSAAIQEPLDVSAENVAGGGERDQTSRSVSSAPVSSAPVSSSAGAEPDRQENESDDPDSRQLRLL